MSHPSYGEDEDYDSFLPDGVSNEQVVTLVDTIISEIEKLGLFMQHAHLAYPGMDIDDEDDEGYLLIHAVFTFGKVAFTPRIQDPTQDKFNDSFRAIALTDAEASAQAIIDQFRSLKKDPDEDSN